MKSFKYPMKGIFQKKETYHTTHRIISVFNLGYLMAQVLLYATNKLLTLIVDFG